MTIQIDHTQLYYEYYEDIQYDDTLTLIFLHDSLGSTQLWRNFPKRLAKATNSNYLIYDRQGYGKSDNFSTLKRDNQYLHKEAHVLNQLISKLNIKNPVLFGHSDGGSIALIAASLYPDIIKAIIVEGAHVFVEDITINGIKSAKKLYTSTNLKDKLKKYHGDKTQLVFNLWTQTWLSEDFQNWNIEKELSYIKCPSLVIQGKDDEYGSMAQVKSIIHNIGVKSEPFLIPNCKHSPHKEQPQLVIDQAFCFLKKWDLI